MGIKNLLPYLSSISNKVTLRGSSNFKVNEYETVAVDRQKNNGNEDRIPTATGSSSFRRSVRKRNLRVGVDISTWISAACHGNGAELLDERHLSNFGRNELELSSKNAIKLESGGAAPSGERSADDLHKEQIARNFIAVATKSVMRKIKSIQYCLTPEIIVVLDGSSPPVKADTVNDRKQTRADAAKQRDEVVRILPRKRKNNDAQEQIATIEIHTAATNQRKISAAKKAGATNRIIYAAVVSSVLSELREKHIAFLVSPYEADGQLAYLNQRELIDYIISEDSDFIPHMANAVLYKYTTDLPFGDDSDEAFENCRGFATLIRKQDLGAVTASSFNLTGFTDTMIACTCVASGCDYATSLKGIGLVTAREAVKDAFAMGSEDKEHNPGGPIDYLLNRLFERCKVTTAEKLEYTENFVKALVSFRHPVVFDPISSTCIYANIQSPDADLMRFPRYASIINGLDTNNNGHALQDIVGELYPQELAGYIAQGYINPKTWELREDHWESPLSVMACLDQWNKRRSMLMPDEREVIIIDD